MVTYLVCTALATIMYYSTNTLVLYIRNSYLNNLNFPSCVAVGCHLSVSCTDATITNPSVTMDACCMSNGQSFSDEIGCNMCSSCKLRIIHRTFCMDNAACISHG